MTNRHNRPHDASFVHNQIWIPLLFLPVPIVKNHWDIFRVSRIGYLRINTALFVLLRWCNYQDVSVNLAMLLILYYFIRIIL
jgi:hypothetical protein